MNAAVSTEVLLRQSDDGQFALPLATPGTQRWVWESQFGPMLIEVMGDAVFVNGQRVQPHVREQSVGSD